MSDGDLVEFNESGELYAAVLIPSERRVLQSVRAGSRKMFAVGDIAEAAWARAKERGIPGWVAFHAVGEEAGIGVRRVMKLRQISERFPEKVRDRFPNMPHAYFEEAFVFPPGDDIQMLEFAHFKMGEDKRWPGAEAIAGDYRRNALGKHTGSGNGSPPPTATIHTSHESHIIPEPVPLQNERYVPVARLRALVSKWKKGKPTVAQCISDIEELIK